MFMITQDQLERI